MSLLHKASYPVVTGALILLFLFKGISQNTPTYSGIKVNSTGFRNWVNSGWSKSYLLYDTLEIEDNKAHLTLLFDCHNDCSVKWNHLKQSFDTISTVSLEEYILNKASFLLEIPRDSIIINIYNKTENEGMPCFYRGIRYKDSLIVKKADCKDLSSSSTMDYKSFNPIFLMGKLKIDNLDRKASEIIDFVYSKCYQYYIAKNSSVKVYRISTAPYSITFEVRNLHNEVIPPPVTSLFKSIEVLRFTISCKPHSTEMQFETTVNGKFGSNLLKPINEQGYNDMEIEYKAELQNYVTEFSNNRMLLWLK